MQIELFYRPGSSNLNPLREMLHRTLQALGLEVTPLEIPLPNTPAVHDVPLSLTVLIDYLDLEPESAQQSVNGERIYLNGTGVPDGEKMRFQIARAAGLKTVLFICTGNAVRSQMAEALVNHFLKGRWAAFSAGFQPAGLHPLVVQVLREIGVDAGRQETKHVDLFNGCPFDRIVSLCSEADRMCTFYPAFGNRVHIPFQDPLTASLFGFGWKGLFRKLRDDLREIILDRLESIKQGH
jgi:arsenate reductase (thioredoxin)